jgi:hypothetical protein
MNISECPREHAVIEAVGAGLWPDRADADLRAHVSSCGVCREVADVAVLLQSDRDLAWRDAQVPASGLVWWRAEMRARAEAARVASRPMTVVQGIALTCALAAVVAGVGVWSGWAGQWLDWLRSLVHVADWRVAAIADLSTLAQHGVFAAVVAGILMLAPVAAYFATSDR